jgi:type IV secretory pathway VirB10-like protein
LGQQSLQRCSFIPALRGSNRMRGGRTVTDDLGVVQGSRIRPLGKFLIVAVVVVSVGVLIYAVFTQGMNWSIPPDADTGRSRIDLNALRDIPPETAPKPVPVHAVLPDMTQAIPTPAPTPVSQTRQKSALEMWREMEAMKAREAPVIFPGFDQKNVQEIGSKLGGGDLVHYHTPPSPYTIMEGSHITATLVSGINSDYSGPITAQVLQSVYDTATGHYPLIPPGARLIGNFDSPSGPLQERIAIKWHRIIFPDTSSFDLPDAPSTDEQGYGGMGGDVNSHHLQKIGAAALLSVLSIGPAIGSAITTSGNQSGYYDPPSTVATMMSSQAGAQAANHANQWLGPYLNRPKTVTIFSGAMLDVFVTKDVSLPGPYVDHAGTTQVITQR